MRRVRNHCFRGHIGASGFSRHPRQPGWLRSSSNVCTVCSSELKRFKRPNSRRIDGVSLQTRWSCTDIPAAIVPGDHSCLFVVGVHDHRACSDLIRYAHQTLSDALRVSLAISVNDLEQPLARCSEMLFRPSRRPGKGQVKSRTDSRTTRPMAMAPCQPSLLHFLEPTVGEALR